MIDFAARLPEILPKAKAWAEAQTKLILKQGSPLPTPWLSDARRVGVEAPENIRIVLVPRLPLPDDDELREIALQTGLLSPETAGLTLGHGIFIVDGHVTRQLLTHEYRHIYQYEKAGSIAAFLAVYLEQITSVGYYEAPLEIDARKHEIQ